MNFKSIYLNVSLGDAHGSGMGYDNEKHRVPYINFLDYD